MGVLDEILKNRPPTLPKKDINISSTGLVWMNMLIEYDYQTGQAVVLRSFSRPASDSTIKQFKKEKPKKNLPNINTDIKEATKLF